MVFKARDDFSNGVNRNQVRACLSYLAKTFDEGSGLSSQKGKWEIANSEDWMLRLKEFPDNMVIDRNLAKYDNNRVIDHNQCRMQNTEDLSSQELSDFKSVSNFDLLSDEPLIP